MYVNPFPFLLKKEWKTEVSYKKGQFVNNLFVYLWLYGLIKGVGEEAGTNICKTK